MHLDHLQLTHFKNYNTADIQFSKYINVIVGNNGMGKTNLLDAVYYLCLCKSNFGLTDKQIIQHDADFFRIEGSFQRNEESVHIVGTYSKRGKRIEKNKVLYSRLADHIGLLPIVMITPYDQDIVHLGSEYRRKIADSILCQLDTVYLRHLMQYNKVLKQRNAYLKSLNDPSQVNQSLLQTYTEQMRDAATYIFEKRCQFIQSLQKLVTNVYGQLSAKQEVIQIEYKSALHDDSFDDLMELNKRKDLFLQRTNAGIHKDDLLFFMNEHPLKKYGSQGQIKSFLLALLLSKFTYLQTYSQTAPILLLDDIFDKLDAQRVEQLLGLVTDGQWGQVFISDTHPDRVSSILDKMHHKYMKAVIQHGAITSVVRQD